MRVGSVCSGIGAPEVAWCKSDLKWETAWHAENDAFPSAVLKHHFPDVPNYGDMTKLEERILSGEIEAPDVLVGGTPCQAFSITGDRKSMDDARGNLCLRFVELANAIDTVRAFSGRKPCIVVWENVPGVFSTHDNAFGCFLGALAGEDEALQPPRGRWTDAGCVSGPKRSLAWRVLDAQYTGVPQRRRRVFVMASAGAFRPEQVLFEREGVRRDTPPSRTPQEEHAAYVGTRLEGSGIEGDIIAFTACGFGGDATVNLAPTMRSLSKGADGHQAGSHGIAIAFVQNTRDEVRLMGGDGQVTGALTAQPGMKQQCFIAQGTVAFHHVSATLKGSRKGSGTPDYSDGNGHSLVGQLPDLRIRRLMPIENERLQGFEDGYTAIQYRGKLAVDGPRLKALGNSMAVPCMYWIGKRIQRYLEKI